ncbi:hypothetical protein ABT218_09535 [Streptomyces sp. NPDC001455]|uniref:hypothetical protein n=1 Tax=Streptomyces sp. NPDC001455 TaxID=3154518 RepID=UPI00332FAB30
MSEDVALFVAAELFEPGLRDGLTAFFQRALHRDVDRRFDTFKQMEDAWRQIFRTADSAKPATTPATVGAVAASTEEARETAAAAAELTTALEAAGLSPRAVSVANGLRAGTVEELLDVPPPHAIARARGAGTLVRRELNRRHKQWTAMLRRPPAEPASSAAAPMPPSLSADPQAQAQLVAAEPVDSLASRLAPGPARKGNLRPDIIRLTLGLPRSASDGGGLSPLGAWPPQTAIAKRDFGVVPVDFNKEFLSIFRALADELNTDWSKVLRADWAFTGSGELKPGLRSYVQRVTGRMSERLIGMAEEAGSKAVLFVHNASLLARYFDGGGHDLLVTLQQAARRPAQSPHGLWWLCPMEDPKQTPSLDGRTVEVVDRATEWAVLDSLFLKGLKATTAETA